MKKWPTCLVLRLLSAWVKIFRINPEFRISRLSLKILNYADFDSFSDKFSDYLNTINLLNFKLFVFVGILQVFKFDFLKFRILEILNLHQCKCHNLQKNLNHRRQDSNLGGL